MDFQFLIKNFASRQKLCTLQSRSLNPIIMRVTLRPINNPKTTLNAVTARDPPAAP
jgi:hypothetical protein